MSTIAQPIARSEPTIRERIDAARAAIEEAKGQPGIRHARAGWDHYKQVARNAPAGAKLIAGPAADFIRDTSGALDLQRREQIVAYWSERGDEHKRAGRNGRAENAMAELDKAQDKKDATKQLHQERTKKRGIAAGVIGGVGGVTTAGILLHNGLISDLQLAIEHSKQIAFTALVTPYGLGTATRFVRHEDGKTRIRFRKQKIDDKFIVDAFRALPDKRFRDEPVRIVAPIIQQGKGWTTAVQLPDTLSLNEDVMKHRTKLERKFNAPLDCLELEGDPVKGGGYVIIRVSGEHASERAMQQWPGAKAKSFNLVDGLPIGQNPMGELIRMMLIDPESLDWTNLIGIGKSRAGKSEWVQMLIAAAQLDPLFDIWLFDGKGNNDFHWFNDTAEVFVTGDARSSDNIAKAGYNILRALQREVTFRSTIVAPLPESKVTPELARRDPRLRPKIVILDEFQEVFNHPKYGKPALELATSLITRVAAFGIIPMIFTQTVKGNNLPWSFVSQFDQKLGFRMGNETDVIAVFGYEALKRGMDCSKIPKSDRGAGIFDDGNNDPTRFKGFLLTDEQKQNATVKAVKLRGGQARKINVNAMFDEMETAAETTRKRNTSGKYKHLLDDILAIETDDAGGRLQCAEILPELPNRPEYEGFDVGGISHALRTILGTNYVRLVKKTNVGKGNKPGVWKPEIEEFLKGTK